MSGSAVQASVRDRLLESAAPGAEDAFGCPRQEDLPVSLKKDESMPEPSVFSKLNFSTTFLFTRCLETEISQLLSGR